MKQKLAIVAAMVIVAVAFFAFGFDRYLSFEGLKATHQDLVDSFAREPLRVACAFMALQATALMLCVPGAALTLGLAGGAIFGFAWGMFIVLVAVVIGDSLAFMAARYLLRDWVEQRFARQAAMIRQGVERDGAYYLFAMRLSAVVPFFVVNIAMALTRMPLRTFAPVSFIGLAPVIAIYVNAGTQLAQVENPGDIVSVPMLASLALFGLMPFALRVTARRFGPAT